MKACLDEHYSPEIAQALRTRSYDVCSVKERPDLRGATDPEVWARMISERRALVTENVADFMALVNQTLSMGDSHYGLILSSPRSMPRSRNTIGLFVERLETLMRSHSGDDEFVDNVYWLQP